MSCLSKINKIISTRKQTTNYQQHHKEKSNERNSTKKMTSLCKAKHYLIVNFGILLKAKKNGQFTIKLLNCIFFKINEKKIQMTLKIYNIWLQTLELLWRLKKWPTTNGTHIKLLNCNFFQNKWNENWNSFENLHYLIANFGTHIKDIENGQFTMALKIYIKLSNC